MRAVGDDRADIAAADDAQRLAGDLDAHEAVLLPLAGLGGGVGLRNLPRQREHQRDGVLGGGDRIAERRVHHDHALGGGGRDVDVVDADAGAADHLEVLGLLQELGGDLGGRADGEAVEARRSASASLSLSAPSFGWKSTSTPRSLKICTAASESASEMRTLGDIGSLASFTLPWRGRVGAKRRGGVKLSEYGMFGECWLGCHPTPPPSGRRPSASRGG